MHARKGKLAHKSLTR